MKVSTAVLLVIVAGGGGWLAYSQLTGKSSGTNSSASLVSVVKGPLRVEVSTAATIYASRSEVVRSEIEGRATILWLVQEGKTVKKGEKLVELDVSNLREKSENQAISVSRARAAKITAEKNLEIQRNQNASDTESARNDVLFAKLELEKFLGREDDAEDSSAAANNSTDGDSKMGVRKQELVAARADIEIAEEEVKRAENRLKWTRELWTDKYVTDNDLEADNLALKKAKKQLTLAKNRLHILANYTLLKTERELMAKVKEAKAEQRRTELRCEAKIAQEEADVSSKRQQFELENAKFKKYNEQIAASKLYAPADGLVVYATVGDRRRREPIDLGTDVREGQEIIKLPDVTSMRLKASVAESVVSKVKEGQRVEIKVQTVQDKVFYGEVTRVAKVHDSNNSWFSDTKEYRTDISLFGNHSELKEGVSATATIKVADLNDVLTVPVQAVQRAGNVLYVWVQEGGKPIARQVEKGLSNERRVEIVKGIAVGDKIWLSTPQGVTLPLFEAENQKIAADEKARKKKLEEEARQRRKAMLLRKRSQVGGAPSNTGSGAPEEASSKNQPKGQKGKAGSQRMAKFNAFFEEVKARFPEDADKLTSRFAIYSNQELRSKIEKDPVLGPKMKKLMAGARRGRRGAGGRRGR